MAKTDRTAGSEGNRDLKREPRPCLKRETRPTDRPEGCRAHFDELLPVALPSMLDGLSLVKPEFSRPATRQQRL